MARNLKRLTDVDLSEQEAREIERQQAEAIAESDPVTGSTMISIRWGRPQLGLVRRAAALLDVPYQVYIKQIVIKQAIADIEMVESVRQPRRSNDLTPDAREAAAGALAETKAAARRASQGPA